MVHFPFYRLSIAATFACILIGCSEGKAGPKAVVKGTVVLDGNTLPDAEVRFFSKENNPELGTAQAKTDAKGEFTIKPDANNNNWLKPGKFMVLVSKIVSTKADGAMGTPTVNLVPAIYNLQLKTPLIVELKDGENKLPTFELITPKK